MLSPLIMISRCADFISVFLIACRRFTCCNAPKQFQSFLSYDKAYDKRRFIYRAARALADRQRIVELVLLSKDASIDAKKYDELCSRQVYSVAQFCSKKYYQPYHRVESSAV